MPVPEPELALVLTAQGEIAGYLVADDVSSRSIEGENPLYLAQAKIYDDSLGLSETIVLSRDVGDMVRQARIVLTIQRGAEEVFRGETSTAAMRRRSSAPRHSRSGPDPGRSSPATTSSTTRFAVT